jgi:RND family efflux transporter MFP subunit
MRFKRGILVGILVVAVLVVTGAVVLKPPAGPPAEQRADDKAALNVELASPQDVKWPETVSVSGPIAAWQEAVVASEVSGLRLAEVLVNVGDTVRKGQVLARFDEASTLAEQDQVRASKVEAEANLAEAEANEARARLLHKSGGISDQELKQYETRAQTARAQIDSAGARLRSLDLRLKNTRVVAPDDGVVSSRMATLGCVANPGSELFRMVLQGRIEWRPELTAVQLAFVKIGQVVTIKLPDGSLVNGKVRQTAPTLDNGTRMATAYVDLDISGASPARAGMYVSGAITLGERPGVAIPASCVVVRDGYEYVFVVGADRHALQTKVVTGRHNSSLVEVASGLDKDKRIVAGGVAFLNDGDVVSVAAPSAERKQVPQ